MADLIEGKLSTGPIAKVTRSGEFQRPDSGFRDQIQKSQAEPGRFHLYVSYACPWAHRTLIARKLKKLERIISVSVSNPYMGENGWTFDDEKDPKYLAVVYLSADKRYTGKISVPVLWDKKIKGIVNNESSEILRIFNSAFDDITESNIDLYPKNEREAIDTVNNMVYDRINNGVYKTGFASTQKAYEKACKALFEALDKLEERLAKNKFLIGDKLTEADIRLFTTLIRFDPVYHGHFKCNLRRLIDYNNLYNYMKSIYQIPEVKETCHFDHIKEHYYKSHDWINPNRIVPLGPLLDLESEHGRGSVEFFRKRDQLH